MARSTCAAALTSVNERSSLRVAAGINH
jgi:hypothetical protein